MEIGSISIRYGDLALIAQRLKSEGDKVGIVAGSPDLSFQLDDCYRAGYYMAPLKTVKSDLQGCYEELEALSTALGKVVELCEAKERNVKAALSNVTAPEGYPGSTAPHADHAAEYYAGVDQAKKDQEEADKKAQEEADKRAAMKEAFLAFLATYYPEAYAAYMQKVHEAEEAEWLEAIKDDPEFGWLYDLIVKEKEKQKKAAEAAEQAAQEAAEALETPGADGTGGLLDGLAADLGSSLVSDSGSGGGLGDLGSGLGSDFGGGGGGLGDLGSGWESDLLDDSIDSGELLDAGDALGEIAAADNPAATDTGMNAAGGDVALDEAEAGALGAFGERLASLASAYGMQAAAVAGAGVALYATREQTTEAVAHVAEFVSTRCKPFASDVMDQVSGAAKKTRVNLSHAKSRVVTPKRDEEAGDLIA